MSDHSRDIRVVRGVPSSGVGQPQVSLRTRRNVMMTMRDGVLLAMDILIPSLPGPFPVILVRTPYNKVAVLSSPRGRPFLERLVRSGYVVAVQDCRGRFNSDGDFDPYRQEPKDGFDTIEWLAQQEWCDQML